ncbi:MAG: hypothetical protein Q8S55_09105 [Methylococcaceae bacterium]|nr:hypothetical protein [Methylococcaceae bacterium]
MATNNSNTNSIADTFDSLDEKLTTAEAICDAVIAAIDPGEDGSQPSKLTNGAIAALLRQASTLLNVANAEAYSLRVQALGSV